SFLHRIGRTTVFGAGNAPFVHHFRPGMTFGAERHSFLHRIGRTTVSGAENAPFVHHFRPGMTFGAERHSFLHRIGRTPVPGAENATFLHQILSGSGFLCRKNPHYTDNLSGIILKREMTINLLMFLPFYLSLPIISIIIGLQKRRML
ncbi:MAG: hypothetical protein IJN06_08125, partial [Bacteroidales bacterium]|nr:hypothetical protein [Bacteroidales bacterium]